MAHVEPAAPPTDRDSRFARDITSLLTLPAFWSGQDPAFVVETLLGALEAVLPIAACYARTRGDEPPLERLRVGTRTMDPASPPWRPLVACADLVPMRESVHRIEVEGTTFAVARLPLGYVGENGTVVVASLDPAFPSATNQITLRAAMTLAASGLETARIIQQRDRAQAAKDEFLAMLGHELRNPLAPILTALRLIEMRAGGHRSREHMIIDRQVAQLRSLVDDLLDISRVARGKLELRRERVDIADVLAAALETITPLVEQRRHHLDVDLCRGCYVDADAARLTQVFTNLLGNAAKYTPPGGDITLRAVATDTEVTVTVADTGQGMEPGLLAKVFDMFVQGPRNPARSEGGLGIGLTLVKTLVEAHGGRVWGESPGSGRGSVFTVRLPRADEAPRPAPAMPAPAAALQPLRILVVDDNRDAADLCEVLIAAAGHEARGVHSGAQAIAAAASWAPHVVLIDIGLPDFDGYTVAERIRAVTDPPPQFIAVTGYGQSHDHERSRRAGFAAHLVKPVDPDRLIAELSAANASSPPALRNDDRADE